MSYKEKPILKLYKYENNSFVMQAQIDDYQECSFEDNLYEAGQFSITINFNIPNAQLFQRGLFIQFGNSWKFGEISKIEDQIGENGKGSQFRIITGYDARYILKRRVIKNMNSNGLWVMTGKGELVLRNLINDQCGTNAENKRKLPIVNTIPTSENAIGKEYSASEQFSNLYEVCKTIATQSEIGWRLEFNGTNLNLVCFNGTDRTQTVQFSTSFDSLADGKFTDSSESFANAIYVGGKGQNDDRDIYEGESAIEESSPSGLDRFECWDNQSSMTTESEYETEALSMLNQYGQTLTMSGNGLAKCPYEYEKEYFVGDKIKIAFSGKSANAQILSVSEHWSWGNYEINFSFGKPLPDLNAQLQLILKQIQKASDKSSSTDSVRWYTIPTDTEMPKADVTYNTIGFIGNAGSGATFKLYLDNEKTGSKTYHVYFKQLGGTGKLTLTTGKADATNLVMEIGTYVAIIYVDENGNVTMAGATATSVIESGNNQPATSGGVANELNNPTVKTYENNTRNNVIIHVGSFTTSNNRRIGLIADVETRRVDSSAQEFVSIGSGNIWSLKNYPNGSYSSEIYLYRTDDLHYDVYLKAVSYAKTYVKMTSSVNFTLDWSVVTSYQGTKIEPVSFISSNDINNYLDNIIYDDSITDCNNAFEKGKTKTYWLNSNVANIPNSLNGWYIISQCNSNQISANNYITQIATVGSNVSTNEMYIRHAYLSSGVLAFSDWVRMVNESELCFYSRSKTTGDYSVHWAKLFSYTQGRQYSSIAIDFTIILHSISRCEKITGFIGGYTQNASNPYIWNKADKLGNTSLYYKTTVNANGTVTYDVYVPTYSDNYMWWDMSIKVPQLRLLTVYKNSEIEFITDVSALTAFNS